MAGRTQGNAAIPGTEMFRGRKLRRVRQEGLRRFKDAFDKRDELGLKEQVYVSCVLC